MMILHFAICVNCYSKVVCLSDWHAPGILPRKLNSAGYDTTFNHLHQTWARQCTVSQADWRQYHANQ